MKIAVTGASGFIGTELLSELNKLSVEIVALTRNAKPDTESDRTVWRTTDYSFNALEKVFEDIETVVHLAGVRGTTSNREDYVVNETITEAVLKAAVSCDVKRIVFASTISVYDDVDAIPWTEQTPLKPRTMYGESKICCEQLIQRYAQENGIDYSILRIAQVLGLGEKRRGMMNVFIDTASEGGEITVIGKSLAKRQYIYVKDLVSIISLLATREERDSQIINVGMTDAYTNLEIARIVNKVYSNLTPIKYDDSIVETIKPSRMSINKLIQEIGYTPMNMEDALQHLKQA